MLHHFNDWERVKAKKGWKIRIVDLRPVAKQWALRSLPGGDFPNIKVNQIGTLTTDEQIDGLFEVDFGTISIYCDKHMVIYVGEDGV